MNFLVRKKLSRIMQRCEIYMIFSNGLPLIVSRCSLSSDEERPILVNDLGRYLLENLFGKNDAHPISFEFGVTALPLLGKHLYERFSNQASRFFIEFPHHHSVSIFFYR